MAKLQEVQDAVNAETAEVWAAIDALNAEIQLLKDELATLKGGTLISTGTGTLTPNT